MKKAHFIAVMVILTTAQVQGQSAGDAALAAAASAIRAAGDVGGAAQRGAAALVDGSRAANDAGRTAIEIAAGLLQVPAVGDSEGDDADYSQEQGGGRGRFLQSMFGGR